MTAHLRWNDTALFKAIRAGKTPLCSALASLWMASAFTTAAEPKAKQNADDSQIVPLKTASLTIFEDFESTAVGTIPKGFTKKGEIAVAEGVAHSGTHALRLNAAARISDLIKSGPDLAALGGHHWGRLFYRVQLPAPPPAHATMMWGQARSKATGEPMVWNIADMSVKKDNAFHYFYSGMYQGTPHREFNGGGKALPEKFVEEWTLVEWHMDHATQTYRFYVNGKERFAAQPGTKNFERTEIPAVFESMHFGWVNHWGKPPVVEGACIVYIDDIAVGKDRIGDQISQPAAKTKE